MAEEMGMVEKPNVDNLEVNLNGVLCDRTDVNSSSNMDTEIETGDLKIETEEPMDTSEHSALEEGPDTTEARSPRGQKRKNVIESDTEEELLGFSPSEIDYAATEQLSKVVARLEAELQAAESALSPAKRPIRNRKPSMKRARADLDARDTTENLSPRPSSRQSAAESDIIAHTSSAEMTSSAASSPASARSRVRSVELCSPAYRLPLERGWRRELVYRAALDSTTKRNADIYYYTPAGKKLRSNREVSEHLAGTGLTTDNFTFFKEPLGVDDPEKEIIRDAKLVRKLDSPSVSSSPSHNSLLSGPREGKRTPKPKPPKGASPERGASTPRNKIKVKSMGSRLSMGVLGSSGESTPPRTKAARKSLPPATNNNTTLWKKPSVEDSPSLKKKKKEKEAEESDESESSSRKSRTSKPKPDVVEADSTHQDQDKVDYFANFYKKSKEAGYNSVLQIFQYLKMREVAAAACVCRLWRELAAAPALWKHVRMKNSQVNDWQSLCAILRAQGTRRLDLRKMLLPPNDHMGFWDQFSEQIATVTTIERMDLCRCPAVVVERLCKSHPNLSILNALAVKCSRLNPTPLAALTQLQELRIKSMSGLSLTADLTPLANLTKLTHLSLTSIKDLGAAACWVVGDLACLESLELGECTFGAEFGTGVLSRLHKLQRLRLERGAADCNAPKLLRALAQLPTLHQLEIINFDIKPGFDDALAECSNIRRLLIIPTYVSQSATTNRQLMSGILRLKDSLTHLMWGVTIELLRVTELFIDQCDQVTSNLPPQNVAAVGAVGAAPGGGVGGVGAGGERKGRIGDSIPVLKPVPGLGDSPPAPPAPGQADKPGPPQVEILPLPSLQKLLNTSLPHTKLKLLRIPFHATWRQSLADFQ